MNPSKKLKSYQLQARCGQSLVEIMIALAIGGLIVGSAVVALRLSLVSGNKVETTRTATSLASSLMDNVRSIAEGDWLNIYNLTKGSQYYLSGLNISSGSENITLNGITYTRYFTVENVNRDDYGRGSIDGPSGNPLEDPSTQKIVVAVMQTGGTTLNVTEYIVRSKNSANLFTDWSGIVDTTGVYTSPTRNYSAIDSLNVSNSGEISLP